MIQSPSLGFEQVADQTSGIMNVNESRKYLFIQKAKSLENLPPTLEALKQHTKQAIYQSNCWNRTLLPQEELPNPADRAGRKTPLVGTIACEPPFHTEASQACYELVQERMFLLMVQVCKKLP